jgi:small subunit ribosomal protein S11
MNKIKKTKKKKKAAVKLIKGKGQVHIFSSYNNTLVTFTDMVGNTLVWGSAGQVGFKGPKKATPYAAGVIIKTIVDKVKDLGLREVDVYVKGVGAGRDGAVRAINANGIKITGIKDITGTPHNGCRPPKARRV